MSSLALADSLIVGTDGKGIRATATRAYGDKLVFTDKESGETSSMPSASVEAVVPFVQRGEQYKPEQIQQNLDLVKKLKPKHKVLLRYLNQIQQEWEALQKPPQDFGKNIDGIVSTYMSGDKSTKSFKSASTSLGMIIYKDALGESKPLADAALAKVKADYVSVNLARLTALSTTNRVAIDEFVLARELARDLGDIGNESQKQQALTLLGAARLVALNCNFSAAKAAFSARKDIDTYLISREILCSLKTHVADTDARKKTIADCMTEQTREISRLRPAYSFVDGYPVGKEDQQVLAMTQSQSSRIKMSTTPEDPQCLIFPLQLSQTISASTPLTMPLRLIFNRAQPTNRVYSAVILMGGRKGGFTHNVKLENVQIKNGRADVVLKEDFAALPKDFVPAVDKEGRSFLLLYLAYKHNDELKYGDQWIPVSLACAFPLVK